MLRSKRDFLVGDRLPKRRLRSDHQHAGTEEVAGRRHGQRRFEVVTLRFYPLTASIANLVEAQTARCLARPAGESWSTPRRSVAAQKSD